MSTMANKSNPVLLYSEFDPGLINFAPLRRYKQGGKFCPVTYGPGKEKILLQTPADLPCPFGVSTYEDEKTGAKSYSIDMAFRDLETNPNIKTFYDKMLEVNRVVLSKAHERSTEWFDKKMSKEVLGEIYRPLVKQPKDAKYSPTVKVKIPISRQGAPVPEIFSESKEKVNLDYITKGTSLCCILELSNVWFVNKTFGVTWKLVQTVVTDRPQQKLSGWAFLE